MAGKIIDIAAHRFGNPDADGPPADPIIEVEQRLLGTLLANPKRLEELPEGFGRHHFLDLEHGEVFEALKGAAATGNTMVLPLVRAALPGMDAGFLVGLFSSMVGTLPGMAKGYAEAVMDACDRRHLVEIADTIRGEAAPVAGQPGEASAIVAKAMLAFERIMARERRWRAAVTIEAAVREAIEASEAAAERADGLSGLSTGYARLDRRIGGMEGGTVIVLAARPGVGKTALGTRIALNVAADGNPVEIISLEMKARQIGRRAAALESGVGLHDIKTGGVFRNTAQAGRLIASEAAFKGLPLLIEDEPSLTVQAIRMRAKAAQRRMKGLGLLVIDHLHIVGRPESAGRHGDTQAITEISAGIKGIAKELDIPVLLLAQLNRGVEGREEKRPTLADLRQSGAIEQDADIVMMLYRHAYHTETREEIPKPRRRGDLTDEIPARLQAPEDQAEVLFEKVRDGERGVEYLRYDAPRACFWEEGGS